MNQDAVRAALAVFLLGLLGVWLVKPIGDACPDVGRLPAGTQSSSAPSFAPPLTRTCTYTTADGTKARKRYVPIVDWLVVAVVAGVAGAGVGLAGPGTPAAERAPGPKRARGPKWVPRGERAPRAERVPRAARAPKPARAKRAPGAGPARRPRAAPEPVTPQTPEQRAAARERERQERAKRRERD